jgi:hypothetical protein
MLVMRRIKQHEMRGCSAYLRASHHQAKVRRFDVLSAHFEAMRHRGAEACFVTA